MLVSTVDYHRNTPETLLIIMSSIYFSLFIVSANCTSQKRRYGSDDSTGFFQFRFARQTYRLRMVKKLGRGEQNPSENFLSILSHIFQFLSACLSSDFSILMNI